MNDAASEDARPRSGRFVNGASLLYGFLCAATVAGLALSRSALHDARLPAVARVCLLGLELLSTALAAALVTALAFCVDRVGERLRFHGAGRAARAVTFAGAVLLAVAYGVSWALFGALGSFLDRKSLALASADSLMLLKHFIELSPVLLVALPTSALAVVYVLGKCIDSVLESASPNALRRMRRVAVFVVGASALLVATGELGPAAASGVVRDERHGGYTTRADVYRHAQRYESGPLSHLLITLASGDDALLESRLAAPKAKRAIHISPIAVTSRPLVDMKRFVSTVSLPKDVQFDVVVLLVESLRPDVLRSTGGAYDVMPALDALAQGSRRYTHAYAESSHSDYADVCPMSSHYPLRSREHHYYPEHPVYPRVLVYDVLKALGYRTAIVSSQNEQWGGMYNYLDTGSLDLFFHAETFHSTVIDPEDTVFSKWAKDYGHSGKVDDRDTVDEAIRWIGQSEKPFFMYLNLQNSHFPYRTPDDFPKRFSPYIIDFPYTFGKFPTEKLEVVKNRYRNSLSYMDAQIGRLIEFLRKTRRLERTILVVTGDNGEAFYEHGSAAHAGPLFEEAVRVPLVVYAPGVTPGDDARLAQHIDIPPTVLGLLGIPQHPSFQGIDLVHTPEDQLRSAYLLVQTAITSQIALVRDGWKLVADFTYRRYYLYDLVHDPGEKKDLADADPVRVAAMAGRLHAFQKAQLDYYADEGRMRSTYPPILSDRDP